MTPRDSNNNLKTKERNQVNSVFPLKGQLLIDLMILYLGSRHLFEVIFFSVGLRSEHKSVSSISVTISFFPGLGFQDRADSIKKKETPFRCFNQRATCQR